MPLFGADESPVADAAGRLVAWAPEAWPIAADWRPAWEAFLASPEGCRLAQRLVERLAAGATVYPAQPLRALALTPLSETRVVLLGQDPYHGPGQAEGLAFSVPPGQKAPPSLRNIAAELQRDLGARLPTPSLLGWSRQGVLLLNATLTVEEGCPGSHARWGWEVFTDAVIRLCATQGRPKAFLLWGAHAQAKRGLIAGRHHLVLEANHPSPLSARRPPVPFMGCGHFGAVNRWLADRHEKTIDWFGVSAKNVA